MLPLLEKLLGLKKPASGLPDSLLAQYRALAESMGFGTEPVEKGLLLRGKTVTLALKIEFGNRWDFFNTITSLRETESDIKILVTSSNSRAMPMETVYTVLKKKLGEKSRWVLLDIEGKKEPMFLNFSSRDTGRAPSGAGAPPTSRVSRSPRTTSSADSRSPPRGSGPRPSSARRTSSRRGKSASGKPEMRKTKNYGMQPVDAPPRRKKIYGKRKRRD
jgi:hypothetical protein